MEATVLREFACELGEGPLWDGETLWFFDILGRKLHRLDPETGGLDIWEGERLASAAARTTGRELLIATETDLALFDPATEEFRSLIPLEADNPVTRSNDGRADRQGGFWIGTMGKEAEHEAGALYRYYRGELRQLRAGITIPNAICFSPDGRFAHFADSRLKTIYKWMLDGDGWPVGAPSVFHVVEDPAAAPDGAVIDETGSMWCAFWGGGRVQRIERDGTARERITLPVSRPSCPAFGPDFTLYITTARQGMSAAEREAEPLAGAVFQARIPVRGLPEPQVILP